MKIPRYAPDNPALRMELVRAMPRMSEDEFAECQAIVRSLAKLRKKLEQHGITMERSYEELAAEPEQAGSVTQLGPNGLPAAVGRLALPAASD